MINFTAVLNVLDRVLQWELSTVKRSTKYDLIFMFVFSIALIAVVYSSNNKILYVMLGVLLFWERYLLLRLKTALNIQEKNKVQ